MTHQRLGLLSIGVCAVILFIWIPLDVDTSIVEKVRRQKELGDAFAPVVAAVLIGLGGLLLLFDKSGTTAFTDPASTTDSGRSAAIVDVTHVIIVFLLLVIAIVLMRYVGPLAVSLFHDSNTEYRLLRDTAPWKYLGFIAGGLWLILSFIVLIEKRLRIKHIIIALIVVGLLIALYDLPFDTLLLPPNGDV